uniref:DNA translocase FtsK 1-like n=1 Tax=Pristiophorus japonicus TaxID=55135 RepID=UPI00398F8B5C
MFTWIAKVAPQPPQPVRRLEAIPMVKDGSQSAEKLPEEKTVKVKQTSASENESGNGSDRGETQQISASSGLISSDGGVLVWIAQNLSRFIPLHIDSPKLPRAARNSAKDKEIKEEEPSKETKVSPPAPEPARDPTPTPAPAPTPECIPAPDTQPQSQPPPVAEWDGGGGGGGGVLRWLVHGLGRVLPQPEEKVKPTDPTVPTVEVTTAPQEEKEEPEKPKIEEPPAEAKPEPEPEAKPEHEPEVKVEVTVVTEIVEETTDQQAEPPTDTAPTVKAVEMPPSSAGGSSVLGWLKQSLGKVVPQPVGSSVPAAAGVDQEPAAPENTVSVEVKKAELKVTEVKEEVPKAVTVIQVAPAVPTPDPVVKEEEQPVSEPITKTSVFSWLVQGLGKVVPQPVIKLQLLKEDDATTTACPAEERGKLVPVSETNGK